MASILLHGAVIGGSLYLSLTPSSPESLPLKQLPTNATRLMDDQFRSARVMTPGEQHRIIEEKLPALNAIKTSEVKTMAALIEDAAIGKTAKENESKPDAKGEFDFDSAMIHDIRRIKTKSDESVYEWVMIDRAGVTMRTLKADAEMTADDRSAARAFELARENPNLRILLESATRIAGSMSSPQPTPQTAPQKGR